MRIRCLTIPCLALALVAAAGCSSNPDQQPELQELAGTWVPTTNGARPPTQFLYLSTNHTLVASNFPVSPSFGKTSTASGSGTWELSPSYSAFRVKLDLQGQSKVYSLRVVGRRSPFVLAESILDDDETLKARRLEDTKR